MIEAPDGAEEAYERMTLKELKASTPTPPPPSETGMTQYRKKPVVIDAVQWFRDGDNPDVRPYVADEWSRQHAGCCVEKSCKKCGTPTEGHGWIDTLEGGNDGAQVVCPGDWIITGVKGEKYPCKPDTFALTYEPAIQPPPSETRRCICADGFGMNLSCPVHTPYARSSPQQRTSPPSETPKPMANIPFQKPLTVLLRRDGGAKQADEDLASISDGLKTVFRIDVPESYFHQLRLRIAENPDLAKQIAVSYLDENNALHSIGLAFEDELHWPSGFLDEAWTQEVAVKKAREARRANG